MSARGSWAAVLALTIVACANEAPDSAAEGAGSRLASGLESEGAPVTSWEDPEPPEAQALAAGAVSAPWNADKTSRLAMTIRPLVGRTSELGGFRNRLVAPQVSLDDRIERLGAEVTGHEITIRLPGSVLFDFDAATVRPDAEPILDEVVAVLDAYPDRPVRIEGHTDAIGSEAYNQTLSEARAAAVRDWLVGHGVATARLTPRGFGESEPVADNSTPEGRQRNRRVEIVIDTG